MTKKKEVEKKFEALLDDLEGVVSALEGGELDLEEAMEAFKKGVTLSKECHKRLDEAERKVKILRRELSGELSEEDFDADE